MTSNEDYTDDVSQLVDCNVDIGDLNHSTRFVKSFRKRASEVILGHWKEYLSTRLVQTGCLPPVKILADLATHKHWTRQIVGLALLMPGSSQLIHAIILGVPKCCLHDGKSLAECIIKVVDKIIKAEQYGGTSTDGAYILASLGKVVDAFFGVKGQHDWDPLHAAATVDTSMRSH